MALEQAVDHRADRLLVADVGGDGLGPAAERLDRLHGLLQGLETAPAADHGGTEAGQLQRRLAPDPAARSGDEADLPVEEARGEDPRGGWRLVGHALSLCERSCDRAPGRRSETRRGVASSGS